MATKTCPETMAQSRVVILGTAHVIVSEPLPPRAAGILAEAAVASGDPAFATDNSPPRHRWAQAVFQAGQAESVVCRGCRCGRCRGEHAIRVASLPREHWLAASVWEAGRAVSPETPSPAERDGESVVSIATFAFGGLVLGLTLCALARLAHWAFINGGLP